MPLILNYAENKNVINQDNLAKKRIVKKLQQQTTASNPQTNPDLEENADDVFNKIFDLSNSIETYLFELGVFVSSEDTSKVDVLAEQSAKKEREQAKVEAEIKKLEAKLEKLQKEIDREEKKKKPDEERVGNLEQQYFQIQEAIAQLQNKLQPQSITLEDFGEEGEMPELEGTARQIIKGKKLVFKEEQSIPIVAKLLNLFKSYKKAWKELIPFSAGLNVNQLTDLGVMIETINKALNSFIDDTKVEIPKNKQRVYEQLFQAVDEISSILNEVTQIYQNIYFYYSQNATPAPPQQSVGVTTGSGFAVRPHYSRTRYL
jgi:division protein CdvB (Snf7/Vps24/ESCRT-III family)